MTQSDDFPTTSDDSQPASKSQAVLHNKDGGIAQGNANTVLGQGAIQVGRDLGGDLVTGKKEITTNIFQGNTTAVIGAIAIVGIVAITFVGLWLRQTPPNGYLVPTANSPTTSSPLTPTATSTFTPTESLWTVTPAPPACYFQGADDEATLRGLIELEGEALARKDLSIIGGIFAPDALIGDAANREIWLDPLARYQAFFDNVQSAQVTRTEVQSIARGLLADAAWFTSGDLTRLTRLDGSEGEYPNPPGSNHWTFARDARGCWQITSLVFNAAHINFPCYCNQPQDEEALTCLINAENQAVAAENPLLIWAIFAPDAAIQDGEVLLAHNPLDFYLTERFARFDYTDPQHSSITKIMIEGDQAIYTSGSQGSYRDLAGKMGTYDNPNPSDRWQFQRNAAGCWVITSFAFNQK